MAIVTWDSVNKGTSVTLSNGNLTAVIPNASNTVRANIGRTNGKWYWEINLDVASNTLIGIVNSLASLTSNSGTSSNVRNYYQTGRFWC